MFLTVTGYSNTHTHEWRLKMEKEKRKNSKKMGKGQMFGKTCYIIMSSSRARL